MELNTERNTETLLRVVAENPTLPIIAMVDSDVVYEDYGRWLASVGSIGVGEYACYNERYYDDREDFKEDYYSQNDDVLCEKFGYDHRINNYALEMYLDEVAERAFSKAIIINIDAPSDADFHDFKGEEEEQI